MNGVGKTSLLVAAMRAAESKRTEAEGRLFNDPFAERLAGPEGMSLMHRAIAASGDQPAIAVRTRFIDDKFNQALADGARQVVILAAGMDSRAYRLSYPPGARVFELDRKEVLDYKHEKLGDAKPACERKALAVDLHEDWRPALRDAGFESGKRTLWTVEGLLMYLEESHVLNLFEKINSLASPGDIMLFDILSQTLLASPFMKSQLDFLASLGAPWKFGTNDPELFMKRLGWDAQATQPGEYLPSRWPFPTAPRNVPNMPRGFYVEARKI